MGISKHERALMELLEVFRGKNTVLCYKDDSEPAGLVMQIAREIGTKDELPVIRICWNENELGNNNFDDFASSINSFYIFRNFTTALIRIEKLIARKKHLIIVSDISNLEAELNSRAYIRFLSILLRKSEDYKSSMITTFSENYGNTLVKAELVPHFNNRFLLRDERIIHENNKIPDIKYSIRENRLHIEPHFKDDMKKIKDIFTLTPEEKKELDKIVGQSLEEYRTSM